MAEPLRAYETPETQLWVDSRDGYVNLRAGPGSDHRVLRPLPNGARLHIFGCGPRSRRARCCLVQDEGTRIVGYAYDAELRHEPR